MLHVKCLTSAYDRSTSFCEMDIPFKRTLLSPSVSREKCILHHFTLQTYKPYILHHLPFFQAKTLFHRLFHLPCRPPLPTRERVRRPGSSQTKRSRIQEREVTLKQPLPCVGSFNGCRLQPTTLNLKFFVVLIHVDSLYL